MANSVIGVLIGLLVAAIPLVALAKRVNISYPIVLVVGGLLLGFIPGLPHVEMDPDLVLLIFLPPLLYWESITAPTDAMMENAGQISLLAVGLVVVTTIAVAILAHAIIPGMSWGAAYVLGAIVSPTDELAAVPVLERFILAFAAYVPAQALDLSGVLAVVTAGVYVNHLSPRVLTPAARTQAIGFYDPVVFLANAALFLLVGLQLHDIALATFRHDSWQAVIGYSVLVNVVIFAVRLILAILAEFARSPHRRTTPHRIGSTR
ncbi:MAG: cation:proton antiporter [Vulcanimicrobiaceae bacterium]